MTTWTECVITPVWREPENLFGAFQRNPGQLTYINGHVRYTDYQDQGVVSWFRKDQAPGFAMHCIEVPLSGIGGIRWRTAMLAGSVVEFRVRGHWYELYFLPPAGYRLSDAGSGVEARPLVRVLQSARYVHHVGGAANMASRVLHHGDSRASRSISDASAGLWRAILGGTVPASIRTANTAHEAGVGAAVGQLGSQIDEPTLVGLQRALTTGAAMHLRQPMSVLTRGLSEDAIVIRGLPAIQAALLGLRSHGVRIRDYDARRSTCTPGEGMYWATQCATMQLGRGGESFACISCGVSSTPDGWRINEVLIDTDKTAREVLHPIFREAADSSH
jgi:hypothetical protein